MGAAQDSRLEAIRVGAALDGLLEAAGSGRWAATGEEGEVRVEVGAAPAMCPRTHRPCVMGPRAHRRRGRGGAGHLGASHTPEKRGWG